MIVGELDGHVWVDFCPTIVICHGEMQKLLPLLHVKLNACRYLVERQCHCRGAIFARRQRKSANEWVDWSFRTNDESLVLPSGIPRHTFIE